MKSSHSTKAQQARLQQLNDFAQKNHTTEPEASIRLMAEAAEIYRAAGDFPLQVRSLRRQAFSMRVLLQFEKIVSVLEIALHICREHSFKKESADICAELCSVHSQLGSFTKARENLTHALDLYRELNHVERQIEALSNFANLAITEGKFREGFQYCNMAFLLCEENSIVVPAMLWHNKGAVFFSIGNIDEGLAAYLHSLEITRRDPLSEYSATTLSEIGLLYWHKGELETALQYMQEAVKEYRRTKFPEEEVRLLCNAAEVFALVHRLSEAEEYIARAMNVLRGLDIPTAMLQVLIASAKLQQAKGNPGESLRLFNEVIILSESINEYNTRTRILLEMSHLHSGSEKERFLKDALAMSEISGQKNINHDIHFALYEYYQQQKDSTQALEHFKTYQALKDEMHAEKMLIQLDVLKVEYEMEKVQKEAEYSKIKLKEITSDLIQRNELLSEIRKTVQQAMLQKGLSQKNSLHSIVRTIEAGATSFWKQLEERSDLIDRSLSEKVLDLCPDFTSLQLRILTLLKARLSNKEIAQLLFITERAVEYHRTIIRKKLNLSSTTNIATYLHTL